MDFQESKGAELIAEGNRFAKMFDHENATKYFTLALNNGILDEKQREDVIQKIAHSKQYIDKKENFTDAQKKAIGELKKLKVYQVMNLDQVYSFDDYWWHCLHEVDIYVDEGSEESPLTMQSAKAGARWLRKYQHLTMYLQNVDSIPFG